MSRSIVAGRIAIGAAFLCVCLGMSAAVDAQPGVPPPLFTNPAEAMEFSRLNLPPGMKAGDILRDQPRYPEGDVADIYRVVLNTLYSANGKRPRIVVLYELADMRLVTCASQCPFIPKHKSRIDTLTLQNFRRATLTRRPIRADFQLRWPLEIIRARQQEALPHIAQRAPPYTTPERGMIEHPYWVGFMRAYPGAWGAAALTQVGFNARRTEAILQVRHGCGAYCGSMEIMLLRKSKGRWRVVERMPESSTDVDLGHRDLRFRGVGAKKPRAEVRAQYAADSLRKMRIPRAVRGRIMDTGSNAGVALARVSLHGGNAPNTPWDQVYSDSAGRYVFVNPPIGGAGIMAFCPKSTIRRGELAGGTGVGVEFGTDTTVDVGINMALCETPHSDQR